MYFCPKCYKKVVVDVSNHIYKGSNMCVLMEGKTLQSVVCEKCNAYMIECDDKLIDVIINLNKSGFITRYCCQGHIDYKRLFKYSNDECVDTQKQKFVAYPYIMFDKIVLKNKKFLEALNSCDTISIDFNRYSNINIYPINAEDDIKESDMTDDYMDICFNNLMNFVNLLLN